jgi:membrane protein required for colicin V production
MILDLIAAVVISYAFYRGYSKGLINTVVDTLSIIIGLVIALKFSPLLIDYMQDMININPALEFILGFLIVFFAVMLLLRYVGEKIEDLLKAVNINIINQLAGGALLGFVAAFCVGALYVLMSRLNILSQDYVSQSSLYEHLAKVSQEGSWLFETFKNVFSEFWSKFMGTLDQVKEKIE